MSVFSTLSTTGTDNTELSALDSNWSKMAGVTSDDAVVTNNRLRRVAGPNGTCKYVSDETPPSANYKAYTDIYVANTTDTTFSAGPMVRASSGLNGYWARWRPGTGFQLFRYNSAVASQLGSTVAQSYSAGQTFRLWLEADGSNIKVYKDAETTPIISVTDGTPISGAGAVGILIGGSSATDGPHVYGFSAETLGTTLAISDATHGHSAENVTLSVLGTLAVADATHAHAADNLTLEASGAETLTIADAAHAHGVDNITLTAVMSGVLTIPAVRDWETGALKLGETGVQVDIRNISTGALVVRKTGQTTHGTTGVCVVTDALIAAGTTYEVVTRFVDGSRGMWDYLAS